MLEKLKVKTWINTLKTKIRKPPKTQGLHVPYQYTQQRTIMKPVVPKPVLDIQPKRKIRHVVLRGFSGVFIVLNGVLGLASLLTNPTLSVFFLVNAWLLIYTYKYMGQKI